MNRWLAAAKLHNFRITLQFNEPVEHALYFGERQAEAVLRVSKANRAIQIAVAVYFNQRQAGVLLVLRAKAAVQRTSVFHFSTKFERNRARLVEPGAADVAFRVGADQPFKPAMLPGQRFRM